MVEKGSRGIVGLGGSIYFGKVERDSFFRDWRGRKSEYRRGILRWRGRRCRSMYIRGFNFFRKIWRLWRVRKEWAWCTGVENEGK